MKCKKCGCTDEQACTGGCFWVEKDLCSNCAEIKGIDVHKLAVFMHDNYEKQSEECGWKTQTKCKVDFEDLPENNKRVMLRVAMLVIEWFNKNQEEI